MLSLDANLVVQMLTGSFANGMAALWTQWHDEREQFVAPSLIGFEITNALYRQVRVGALDDAQMVVALASLERLPIKTVAGTDLHRSAFDLAARFKLPAAYDAHYLAVADRYQVPLWTMDQRLYNSVHRQFPLIRLAA